MATTTHPVSVHFHVRGAETELLKGVGSAPVGEERGTARPLESVQPHVTRIARSSLLTDKSVSKLKGSRERKKQHVQVMRSALFYGEHPTNLTAAQAEA